jgi:molecular chaperone DnaK
LPLVKNSYNFFRFTVLDNKNNPVETDAELIGIAQGKYNVAGQPLPHDISLETDNNTELETNATKLDLFFQKNTILPLKRTKQYTLHKSIIKGSNEKIVINVLEGPESALPEANQSIGYIEIDGNKVSRDIVRGTDIEITLEMSESRDLKVTVYIPMSDQQFSETFNPSQRHLPVAKLQDEVVTLSEKLDGEIEEAIEREDYETADELNTLKRKIDDLVTNATNLTSDDVTDKKFQFEDSKRKIAQEIDNATKDKRISILKMKYNEDKEWCKRIVDENGNDRDHKIFGEITGREQVFLNSITPLKIMEALEELLDLGSNILWRTPAFLEARFNKLIEKPQLFNDQEQAKSLIEAGNMAKNNKNFDRLKKINWGLISLLPKSVQQEAKTGKIGF